MGTLFIIKSIMRVEGFCGTEYSHLLNLLVITKWKMYVKWRYLAVTSSDGSQNLVLLVGKPETLTFPTVKKHPSWMKLMSALKESLWERLVLMDTVYRCQRVTAVSCGFLIDFPIL